MKQRFELYIGTLRADLSDGSPVLFNYTAEELENPTIAKNSYSQQLTLPATVANDRIFQCYWRADAAPGTAFNPAKRVPFTIFADGGRVVQAGYVKLDSAARKGGVSSYKVTLYGGLGGFLYSLHYKDDGTRTLADLDYTDGNGNPVNLGFTVNRATIMDAWQNITAAASKWSILNFAPCYNGLPENFDADRALIRAADFGLQDSVTDPDTQKTYKVRNGFAIVDLPSEMTEWQVKDLRSYLQRPVLSVPGLLRAICNPNNNGGYTVKLGTSFFNASNYHYKNAWMTLKRLGSIKTETIAETITANTEFYGEYQNFLGGPENATGTAEFVVGISKFNVPADTAVGTDLFWYGIERGAVQDKRVTRGIVFQVVGYDSEDNAVCGSKVYAFGPDGLGGGWTCKDFCNSAGYTPRYDTGEGDDMYATVTEGHFNVGSSGVANWTGGTASLKIAECHRVTYFRLYATRVTIVDNYTTTWPYLQTVGDQYSDLDADRVTVTNAWLTADMTFAYQTNGQVGSGTNITKAMLLSDTMSPAEFLLSYCKRYGLLISVDENRKEVTIEQRTGFYRYQGLNTVDLTGLIDRSRDVSIVPVLATAERMEFKEDPVGAAYGDEYKSKYGVDYGAQRVNTGYEFNAELKALLQSYKFKAAPEVKARDLTFLTVLDTGNTPEVYPAVFLNSGLKYHLFSANNRDTNELDVPPVPGTVEYGYWNRTYKTYDVYSRLQLCDKDGKGKDGDGVLVFYQDSYELPQGFAVSDDEAAMFLGNEENPCWILEPDSVYSPGTRLSIPLFGRFWYRNSASPSRSRGAIYDMQEFGIPQEIDIPGISISRYQSVFRRWWRDYMKDRYNQGTKVLTCYVYASRLPDFGPDALRRFYWFDGALWALNKIHDYDLNGNGLTKCEFVQVQDPVNYYSISNVF